jgi:DUF1680 family protein
MMFCRRMNAMYRDVRFADVVERALYNTVLAGISLAGTEFFYVNPLESDPKTISFNPLYEHVKPVRQKWFDCSCCPTNIARTVMGLGGYAYGASDDGLYVNLYCAGSAKDGIRAVTVATAYPYGDTASLTVSGGSFKLYLRSPENAPVTSVSVNGENCELNAENGYIVIQRGWNGDTVALKFDMEPKRVYSSVRLQSNSGKAAVMRGPLVYCIEQADNGELLGASVLPQSAPLAECPMPEGLPDTAVALKAPAYRYHNTQDSLYPLSPPMLKPHELTLIPYFLWANRGENEMRVFIQNGSHCVDNA